MSTVTLQSHAPATTPTTPTSPDSAKNAEESTPREQTPPQTPCPTRGPTSYRFTREEYHRLGELGFFQDTHTQLVDGQILAMSPKNNPHILAKSLAGDVCRELFPSDAYWVREQEPLVLLTDLHEPEPDVSVVADSLRDWLPRDKPQTAELVIEVADTSLAYDRNTKAGLYAAAGIGDYWIINLIDRRLEVYRKPMPDAQHPFGHRYGDVTTLLPGEQIAPLVRPEQKATVDDLLP